MRRVFVPALLAVALIAVSASNASAFGFLNKLCDKGCDTGCDLEPTCGCEAPVCDCEVIEPACGCEVAACDSGCGHAPKFGLLRKLFAKHHGGCDAGCDIEPACGCEIAPAPTCGCEVAPAPTCGCEIVEPACGCEAPSAHAKLKGFFAKLFHKHSSCDAGCDVEPTCGCEIAPAPACGCAAEPTCGVEPSCGCGL